MYLTITVFLDDGAYQSTAVFVMLLGFLFLLPFLLFFHSIQVMVLVPVSLWHTFTNKQVRRNHALEHATANVLEEQYGVRNIAGMAFRDGFALYGLHIHPSELMAAAREALRRLKNGESHLALHPRCGTSLLVGQFLYAILFLVVFFFLNHLSLIELLVLFASMMILSRPLGLLARSISPRVRMLRHWNSLMSEWWLGQCYFRTALKPVLQHTRSSGDGVLHPDLFITVKEFYNICIKILEERNMDV